MENSKKFKIFVDGQEGTTGLQINDYLAKRNDIEVLKIDNDKRKDLNERAKFINESDITFLCLPDEAAKESVSLCSNPNTCIIDTSTAHRTNPDWVYALPELSPEQRNKIKNSKRLANPGCHASAFILAVKPLIATGILKSESNLMASSLTGYSGGGKKMIADYQQNPLPEKLLSARPYALNLTHKHLPEMQKYTGLRFAPTFQPIVGNWYKGLAVSVFLDYSNFTIKNLNSNSNSHNSPFDAKKIHEIFKNYYRNDQFIRILPYADLPQISDNGFFDVQANNNTNFVDIAIFGDDKHLIIMSRLDNLGKGASGSAVQAMNMYLGLAEETGLV